MTTILQMLIAGIAFGCIYCLVAIEITLIYSATGMINFGHEKFIVLGAFFFGGTLVRQLNLPLAIAAIGAIAMMAVFGAGVAATVFNPLRNMSSDLFALMGTVLLANIIREAVRLIWGPAAFRVTGFLSGNYKTDEIIIPKVYVYIILASVAFIFLQNMLFMKTKLGRSMRCVNQDKMASALMGINVSRSIVITIGMSASVCAVVALLIIPIFNIDGSMATMIALKGFAAGVVGGFGTMTGAIYGGLFIGLLENIYVMFGPSLYKDVVAFVAMIIFLLIRPEGIVKKRS